MLGRFILLFLFTTLPASALDASDNCDAVYHPNQTSASLLIAFADCERRAGSPASRAAGERKYLLLYDIYIKARSYAWINKVFFWLSIIGGLSVLVWPALSVVFTAKLDRWEWLKSATVQTTVTGIAALMFAFYIQYKDKQTYAETLMRHVLFSEQDIVHLVDTVTEELARIDRGFSFNSIFSTSDAKDGAKAAAPTGPAASPAAATP